MIYSAIINIWLVIITIKTLRLIQNNMDEHFKSEIIRIKVIYWTFIVSYTSWMFFDFEQIISPDNDGEDYF